MPTAPPIPPVALPYVSTGHLPPPESVQALVEEAHRRFASEPAGRCSDVYPALARVSRDLFGISVVGTNGRLYEAGDAAHPFTIMSVSKPFVFALVCQVLGATETRERIGANATGLAFNSITAVEKGGDGRTNPMVNPGAIVTTSFASGTTPESRWAFLREGLSRFAGRELSLDDEVFLSATRTNHRNRSAAALLHTYDRLGTDPEEAVDLYTRQCALSVSAHDLAVMGATLADGGTNPITRQQVVDAEVCKVTLALMATAGMYGRTWAHRPCR